MIATSSDGQWAAILRGRELSVLAGGSGPATGRAEIAAADADVIVVGPPSIVVVVTRGDGVNRLTLYMPPYLDAVAQHELDAPMRIAAITGPRIALLALDGSAVVIVRIAGRALSTQTIEPGGPVEFAVGLERNQVLLGLMKKLEAWDAVSGRPLLRMQLPLPPPPRILGQAHGHLWVIRPRAEDLLVCRMSDGRPFRHYIGAPIDEIVSHPASPLLIAVTQRGLVRLHCFAHSLTVIDAPWQPGTPLAQLVVGEDISLIGLNDGDDEPWRVPIGGAGAPAVAYEPSDAASEPPLVTAADKLRAMRERDAVPSVVSPAEAPPKLPPVAAAIAAARGDHAPVAVPKAQDDSAPITVPVATRPAVRAAEPVRRWREPLAAYGAEVLRGAVEAELPVVGADNELGQLAQRLGLSATARRALIALYALYLNGEARISIARLAQLIGDWSEPLGQGELVQLALVHRRGGKVWLRAAFSDALDGAREAPR